MPTSPDTPHFSTAGMSQKEAAAAEAREKSARRRSTMNSRDAAYEANLAEALRLSKAAAGIKESSPMPDLQASYRDEAGASSVDQNQHLELKREFDPSLQGPDALNEEHAGAGPDQRAYTEDPAQYTTSDWQVDKTNRASSASALENGKRRRNSTDAVGMAPEPGPYVTRPI